MRLKWLSLVVVSGLAVTLAGCLTTIDWLELALEAAQAVLSGLHTIDNPKVAAAAHDYAVSAAARVGQVAEIEERGGTEAEKAGAVRVAVYQMARPQIPAQYRELNRALDRLEKRMNRIYNRGGAAMSSSRSGSPTILVNSPDRARLEDIKRRAGEIR